MRHRPDDSDPLGTLDTTGFAFTRRAWVPASPTAVYDLVSDVSRIGEWSPNASEVRYDLGAGPEPGAWFSGRNRRSDSGWESRSQVLTAERGAEFSFVVGGLDDGVVRWRWTFRAEGTGTVVEQSWQLLRMDPCSARRVARSPISRTRW